VISETSRVFSIALLQVGLGRLQRAQRLQPVHARHHDVEQHDVGRIALLHRRQHFVAA